MIDLIRFLLSAWAIELALVLMPPVQEAEGARLYLSRACTSLVDALEDED